MAYPDSTQPVMKAELVENSIGPFRTKRLLIALLIVALAIVPGHLGELTRTLLTDAYVQVSAFVAATLLLFYGAERIFNFNLGTVLRNAKEFQVPAAAILGATPGCGGAVVVVAAYSSGNVGLGAVVAALTATMGDAAFLLIATRPDVALVVLPVSITAGILTGYLVDRFETREYRDTARAHCELAPVIGRTAPKHILYLLLAIPGLFFGVSQLLQIDIAQWEPFVTGVALAGTAVGLYVWSTSEVKAMTNAQDGPVTRMAEETSFISVWVIFAYLTYDYLVDFAGLDLEATFSAIAVLLPLIAVVIGFVPGCGPQVLVTTLYINGVIPFAALMGNAISNDGDALFPAIAINPKAAVVATLYSAIPALLVAYGFFFLAPDFL